MWYPRRIGRGVLIWGLALFLAASANLSFFEKTAAVYPLATHWPFLLSIAAVLVCVLAFVTAVFSLVFPVRLVGTFLLLVAAVAGHFADTFGVVIETEMIRNVMMTNASEAGDIVTGGLLMRVLLLGLLPAAALFRLPLKEVPLWRRQAGLAAVICGATALTFVSMLPFTDAYASYLREHKPLRYYSNPTYPIYSAVKFVLDQRKALASNQPFKTRVDSASTPEFDEDRELVILVLGETVRADHFGVNGYHRMTTPYLSSRPDAVSFRNMTSCGTSTAVSLPCMFSLDQRANFELEAAARTENVLDVLSKAGVSVLWRDNNSGSKGVADRVAYQRFNSPAVNPICDAVECRDEGMLSGLGAYVEAQSGDVLIVLHQMGSHGPAYFKRYPESYRRFTPDCRSIELSDCSLEEIVNAYDNTILYTDHFLDQVIQFLEARQDRYETAMFYVGDHGESLGEYNIYLHGLPYSLAPAAQTHVPFVVWAGTGSDIDRNRLAAMKDARVTHDDLSVILLDAFEIEVVIGGVRSVPDAEVLPMVADDNGD